MTHNPMICGSVPPGSRGAADMEGGGTGDA